MKGRAQTYPASKWWALMHGCSCVWQPLCQEGIAQASYGYSYASGSSVLECPHERKGTNAPGIKMVGSHAWVQLCVTAIVPRGIAQANYGYS